MVNQKSFRSLPHRQAWHLAWPMILSNISVPLMGLADTAMLGHLDSPLYLGAVAVGSNLLALFYWMFAFLRMSTTSLTGQAKGANDQLDTALVLFRTSVLALGPALLLIISQFYLLPFGLSLMAEDQSIQNHSLEYCEIRIFSAPAVFLTYVCMGWFIGLQNTRLPLIITVLSNLLNLGLDYLFIVKFGWAHRGAALATLIAEYSALVFAVLGLLFCYRNYLGTLLNTKNLLSHLNLRGLLALNTDLFIRTTVLLLVFNFLIMQSAKQGEAILAANAIILQFMLFVAFALDGYAHAAESMVAHAMGAKNNMQLQRAVLGTSLPAIFIAFFLVFGFYFFKSQFIGLMSDQHLIQETTRQYFYWLYLLPLVSVGCYMLDGIFIGAGQTRLMLLMMLISVVFVFFPSWWLLVSFKNHGLWAAFTLFNFSRTCLMYLAYYSLSRKSIWIRQ